MTALIANATGIYAVPGHCSRWFDLYRQRAAAVGEGCEQIANVLLERLRTHLLMCDQCREYEEMQAGQPDEKYELPQEQLDQVLKEL